MIRIVKRGADTIICATDSDGGYLYDEECYRKSDTVLIDKNWRPEDIDQAICHRMVEDKLCGATDCDTCDIIRQRTWQACLEAMEKI